MAKRRVQVESRSESAISPPAQLTDLASDGLLYRHLFENALHATWIIDRRGAVVQANRKARALCPPQDGEALLWQLPCWSDESGTRLRAALEEALSGGSHPREPVELHVEGRAAAALRLSVRAISTTAELEGLFVVDAIDERSPPAVADALKEGEVRFRGLLEAAPDAIVLVDEAGKIALINAQAERLFGYQREELEGAPLEALLPGGLRGADRQRHRPLAPGRAGSSHWAGGDVMGLHKDGMELPLEVSFSPLELPERGLAMGIIRDVSQRRQAELELAQRARQEAAIAEFGRTAVIESDLKLLIDRATRVVARTLGVSMSMVLKLADDGSSLAFRSLVFGERVSDEVRSRVDRRAAVPVGSLAGFAVRSGEPVVYRQRNESRFDTAPLEAFGIRSAAAVVVRLQDRPYGCLAAYSMEGHEFSIEDIHFLEAVAYLLSVAIERKHAEDAVRRDRDFAESLIGTAQAIVLVLDTEGRILRFNPYTEELTGYRLSDIQGRPWHKTLLPTREVSVGLKMFEDAAAGDRLCNAIVPVTSKQGTEHEIEWSGRALTDENGAVTGVLFIGHDITELHQAQKKLLESERLAAIGQMASGLAHESRNALQQIGACAEMLTMELEGMPAALDLVSGVQEAEDRLHRLFDDVRAYAVPVRLNRFTSNVAEVWRKAWAQVSARHPTRRLELTEHVGCHSVELSVDPASMEQAFINIFENAVDAAPDPLRMEIHCDETSPAGSRKMLRIVLCDNGPGITAEQHQKMLLPFYTTKTQGTGLGLPIVKRVLEAHDGWLEIGAPGGPGAEFTFNLPIEMAT